MLITQGGLASITAYPNMVTKSQGMQNQVISKKKMNKKMKGCCVKNIAMFLWMF